MSYQVRARPEVRTDLVEAAEWYERQRSGLGAEFSREARQAIRSLKVNPFLYRIRHPKHQVRWMLLQRFPYRIVFIVEGEVVSVLAVTHVKRHDRHWKERL